MAYRMAQVPMTFSEAEGHFCCFNLCNTHNSKYGVLTTVCLHINWKVHVVCDLNFIGKGEGPLKVTSSHIY